MKFKTTNCQIVRKSQGVELLEHLEAPGKVKIRISIDADSYKQQGHCHLDAFDPQSMKWNRIADRPAEGMATDTNLAYLPDRATRNYAPDFQADRLWLLKIYESLVS
jgi:hypothetical protein